MVRTLKEQAREPDALDLAVARSLREERLAQEESSDLLGFQNLGDALTDSIRTHYQEEALASPLLEPKTDQPLPSKDSKFLNAWLTEAPLTEALDYEAPSLTSPAEPAEGIHELSDELIEELGKDPDEILSWKARPEPKLSASEFVYDVAGAVSDIARPFSGYSLKAHIIKNLSESVGQLAAAKRQQELEASRPTPLRWSDVERNLKGFFTEVPKVATRVLEEGILGFGGRIGEWLGDAVSWLGTAWEEGEEKLQDLELAPEITGDEDTITNIGQSLQAVGKWMAKNGRDWQEKMQYYASTGWEAPPSRDKSAVAYWTAEIGEPAVSIALPLVLTWLSGGTATEATAGKIATNSIRLNRALLALVTMSASSGYVSEKEGGASFLASTLGAVADGVTEYVLFQSGLKKVGKFLQGGKFQTSKLALAQGGIQSSIQLIEGTRSKYAANVRSGMKHYEALKKAVASSLKETPRAGLGGIIAGGTAGLLVKGSKSYSERLAAKQAARGAGLPRIKVVGKMKPEIDTFLREYKARQSKLTPEAENLRRAAFKDFTDRLGVIKSDQKTKVGILRGKLKGKEPGRALQEPKAGVKTTEAGRTLQKKKVVKPFKTQIDDYRKASIKDLKKATREGDIIAESELHERTSLEAFEKKSKISASVARKAYEVKKSLDMSDEDYKRFKLATTGKESVKDFTKAEGKHFLSALDAFRADYLDPKKAAPRLLKALEIQPNEEKILRSASGNMDGVLQIALERQDMPLSLDKQLRGRQIRILREITKNVAKDVKRSEKWAMKKPTKWRRARFNPFVAMRYALMDADVKTGIPIAGSYEKLLRLSQRTTAELTRDVMRTMKDVSKKEWLRAWKNQYDGRLNEWLYTEQAPGETPKEFAIRKELMLKKMDPAVQKVAVRLHKLFYDDAAWRVRKMSWKRYFKIYNENIAELEALRRKKGKLKKSERIRRALIEHEIDKAKRNIPKKALEEGVTHLEAGDFDNWIREQTWGTRANYFMSEHDLSRLIVKTANRTPPDMPRSERAETVRAGVVDLNEIYAREKKAKVLKRPAIQSALQHLEKIYKHEALGDELEKFWKLFARANPTDSDFERMNLTVNNLLGIPAKATWVTKTVGWFTRQSWRFLPLNMAYSLHFAGRQVFQNLWAPAQISVVTFLRHLDKAYRKGGNPWMAEDFTNEWASVSEKSQFHRSFMLQKEGAIMKDLNGDPAVLRALDKIGSIVYSGTDEANRRFCYPIFHDAAYHELARWRSTKNLNRLVGRLKIDTLHTWQIERLNNLLAAGEYRQFVRDFARYKTENVHFRYSTPGRSLIEQSRGGRLGMGIVVFWRGFMQQLYYNGIKPIVKGLENNNYRRAYRGLTTIVALYIGSRASQELSRIIMGKREYEDYSFRQLIFGYTPMSLGANRLLDFFQNVIGYSDKVIKSKGYTPEAADKIADNFARNVGPFLPIIDTYITIYEAQHDIESTNFWRLIRSKVAWRQKRYDRTEWQKWQKMLFGSETKEHEYVPWDLQTSTEKFLRYATGKQAEE